MSWSRALKSYVAASKLRFPAASRLRTMPPANRGLSCGSTRQDAGELLGKYFQTLDILGLFSWLFGDAPAFVADGVEGLHNRRPVVVPFEERHTEAFGLAEFLDV